MDYYRPKLWLNVAGFVFCCAAAAYLLYEGMAARHDLAAVLLKKPTPVMKAAGIGK